MPDIKAVFFDIDGTLVPFGEAGMRPETIAALNALRARGIKVFINTGRPRYFITNLGDYPFDGYVCMNGGLLILDGKPVWKMPIDPEGALEIIRKAGEAGLSCVAFTLDGPTLNFHSEKETRIMKSINIVLERTGNLEEIVARGEDIYQFTVFADREEEKIFHTPLTSHIVFPRWSEEFMDVDPDSTSKADGLRMMAGIMGIEVAQTMAFGDGGNDMSMIRAAGIGVAMGNAAPQVQVCADYVTARDTEDGIAEALRYFRLI